VGFECNNTGQFGVFVVVSTAGEIDLASAPTLDGALAQVVESGRVDVVVDLTLVTFLDSSGLGVLVKYFKRVGSAGGQLRLVVTNPAVRQVLELTGLHSVFAVYDDLDSALK